MKFRSLAMVGSLMLVFAMPAAAHAYDSFTSGAVNMRTGAGTDHARIATLPEGAPVSVDHCRKGWCLVTARDLKGWVSGRFLARARDRSVRPYYPPTIEAPPPAYVPPPVEFHFDQPRRRFHDYGLGRHHKFQRRVP